MILLWFKILFYKIIKAFRTPATDAATGTETVPAPRVRETGGYGVAPKAETKMSTDMLVGFQREPGAPDDTIRTERLRRLIELGLVHEPSPVDALRLDLLHADREARQARAQLTHDPRECPCAGRHYPSADACRWCVCHRPLLDDQLRLAADARRIFGDLVDRSSAELCMWCGHPQHARPETKCSRSAEGMPGNPDGSRFMCGCVAGIEMIERPLQYDRPSDVIKPSSPAKEIVVCGVCGHPDHTAGDGRCAFQVASRMQDEGFHTCRCVAGTDRLEIES